MKRFFLALLGLVLCCTPAFAEGDFDFRKVKWGMLFSEVPRNETATLKDRQYGALESQMVYEEYFFEKKCALIYFFNKNKLFKAAYVFSDLTERDANDIFNTLAKHFSEKYERHGSLYKNKNTVMTLDKDASTVVAVYKEISKEVEGKDKENQNRDLENF